MAAPESIVCSILIIKKTRKIFFHRNMLLRIRNFLSENLKAKAKT